MTGQYTLYGRNGSGSSVCEAMLELTGLPYELVEFDKWKGKAPAELLAVNPLGQIPALVLPDGSVMTESAAILLYLADNAPEAKLAPQQSDPMRSRYLRWMVYLATNNYMTGLRVYYPERYSTDVGGAAGIKSAALDRYVLEWSAFSDALGKGPYILGEAMSAVDLYAAMLMSWDLDMAALFGRHPNLRVLYNRVVSLPSLIAIWKRHGV
jgi:glutathione S-transferase